MTYLQSVNDNSTWGMPNAFISYLSHRKDLRNAPWCFAVLILCWYCCITTHGKGANWHGFYTVIKYSFSSMLNGNFFLNFWSSRKTILNQAMPLGLLCSSGSKNEDDARACRTNVELLDKTVLHLDLEKNTTGAGCLEIIGGKIGLSEVSFHYVILP